MALGSRVAQPSTAMAFQTVTDVGITQRLALWFHEVLSDSQLLSKQENLPPASLALAPT